MPAAATISSSPSPNPSPRLRLLTFLPPFGGACQSRSRTLVAQIQTMRKIT